MMDGLQNVDMRTPIEFALDIDGEGMTTARKLYDFLELRKSDFSRWCKTNITENEFATENEDYIRFFIDAETPTGGKFQREDYKITAHFAKKLSVKGNSEKSEQAREYFTRIEEKVKQKAIDLDALSPTTRMLNILVQSISQNELEQKRMAEEQERQKAQIEQIGQNQAAIAETFQTVNDLESFQKWANSCVNKIADSPNFKPGESRNAKYSLARSESYERLAKKRNCRLDDRVQRAKGRALEEKPDIKKADLNKINKLYVIANDKDLRPAYELVLKEMMLYYCVKTA